jgi:hypothetical protein
VHMKPKSVRPLQLHPCSSPLQSGKASRRVFGVAVVAFVQGLALPAGADLVFPDTRKIGQSLVLELGDPRFKDKVFFVQNTALGAFELPMGKVVPIRWTAKKGPLRITFLDGDVWRNHKSKNGNLSPLQLDEVLQTLARPCGKPFDGQSEALDEVDYTHLRWFFRVRSKLGQCDARRDRVHRLALAKTKNPLDVGPLRRVDLPVSSKRSKPRPMPTAAKPTASSSCAMLGPGRRGPRTGWGPLGGSFLLRALCSFRWSSQRRRNAKV